MEINKIKPFTAFLCKCAGASLHIMEKCPTQVTKYSTMGTILLITALMASLSGGYFFFAAFKQALLAILFGIFWGLVIFSLDRYLVTSMDFNANRKYINALPRIFLAICLGIVVAKPLELKLFEHEIETEMVNIRNQKHNEMLSSNTEIAQIDSTTRRFENERNQLDSMISKKRREWKRSEEDYYNEVNGKGSVTTTGRQGYGKEAERKDSIRIQVKEEYEELNKKVKLRINNIDKDWQDLQKKVDRKSSSIKEEAEGYEGPLAEIEALSSLTSKTTILKFVNIFLTLIFILIETAPVLVKFSQTKGLYEELLEAHEKENIKNIQDNSDFQEYEKRVEAKRKISQYNGEVVYDEQIKNRIWKEKTEFDLTVIEKQYYNRLQKLANESCVQQMYEEIIKSLKTEELFDIKKQ
ncbi:MAG: DUF4407 domain-containing protein [Bacteroidales bacterium]|nr:MAG: DUF4407 domain-containing protein [Bacteroidales bacterium]